MVRQANDADTDFLVNGIIAMAHETENLALEERQVRQAVQRVLQGGTPARYWVLEVDGRRLAQLMITFEWSDWRNRDVWWIQSVYVVPDARRQGCFKQLYEEVRREARRQGAGGLRLYVENHNRAAQKVYERLGMHGDRYRVYEDMFSEPSAAD